MHWALPAIALALLGFAAVSGRLEGTPITAPIVFTAVGLFLGVDALGLVEPGVSSEPVKLLAEATLAIVLFGDASRIDLHALRDEVSIPALLLGIGLPLTIVAGCGTGLVLLGRAHCPRGAAPRHRPGADGRSARAGGRHPPPRCPYAFARG